MYHTCIDGEFVDGGDVWWVNDYQGIPLCKVCDKCEAHKLSKFNSFVLNGYSQSDIDEPINEEG